MMFVYASDCLKHSIFFKLSNFVVWIELKTLNLFHLSACIVLTPLHLRLIICSNHLENILWKCLRSSPLFVTEILMESGQQTNL